jgi:two-component system response regulator CpxR
MKKQNLCKSILIAEDNEDIRETIEETLRSVGYEVFAEKDGKEALKRLKQMKSPTLVLLDLMMPVMSGWEFLDAQRDDAVLAPHQVVTISAVSATESLEDQTPLKTAGNLMKPISLGPLLETVQKFCGMPSQAR